MTLIEHKVETGHKLGPSRGGWVDTWPCMLQTFRQRFALLSYFSHDPFGTHPFHPSLWIIVIIPRAFLSGILRWNTVSCDDSRELSVTTPSFKRIHRFTELFSSSFSFFERNFARFGEREREFNPFVSFGNLWELFVEENIAFDSWDFFFFFSDLERSGATRFWGFNSFLNLW